MSPRCTWCCVCVAPNRPDEVSLRCMAVRCGRCVQHRGRLIASTYQATPPDVLLDPRSLIYIFTAVSTLNHNAMTVNEMDQ